MPFHLPRPQRRPASAAEDRPAGDADRIARWLRPRHVLFSESRSGPLVLEAAAKAIAAAQGLAATLVFDALSRREAAGSTALGHGVAIPHARIDGIDEPVTAYVRTAEPVPFGASDGAPVSHFLVILVPRSGASDDHLQLLAAVARLVSSRRFRNRLRDARSVGDIDDVFRGALDHPGPVIAG